MWIWKQILHTGPDKILAVDYRSGEHVGGKLV